MVKNNYNNEKLKIIDDDQVKAQLFPTQQANIKHDEFIVQGP